ncbi:MAG: hypothetical protein CMI60_03075 [Parvibaculum sp.]|nr:hypothetical protein [Parvibaculum sp.]
MALESGTYIDSLNSSNPAATDALSAADDHLRLIKGTIKASFPGVTGAVTSTHAELNILDGVTSTAAELNILDGVTSTAAELNILDGVTSTAAELNLLDGVTATTAELNYVDGVTSNIQTQLNAKQASNDILTDLAGLTQAANKVPYFSSSSAASVLDFKDEDDMASNSATAVPSQQSVKAYVDASGISKFESSATSFSNGALITSAHSLGAVPTFVTLDLVCTSAELGYSVNDVIQLAGGHADPSGGNEGVGIRKDSTNVYVRIGSSGIGEYTYQNSGSGQALNSSKWNLVIKAYLVS